MNQQQLETKAIQAINVLRSNGFSPQADKLARLVSEAKQEGSIGDSALQEICGLCSVKAFGDLNIQTLSGREWLVMLNEIRQAAKS